MYNFFILGGGGVVLNLSKTISIHKIDVFTNLTPPFLNPVNFKLTSQKHNL